MKKLYTLFTFCLITSLSFGQAPGDIIITEIMQNPAAVSDANGEWFEVYNTTGADIDMDGWTVRDNDTDSFVISGTLIVPAGGYIVLGNNGNPANNGGVNVDYVFTELDMIIANGADEIVLEAPGPVIIDEVVYDGGPNFPDPDGASMELSINHLNATDNDNGANWAEATASYGDGDLGTPGTANDFTLSTQENELLEKLSFSSLITDSNMSINISHALQNASLQIYNLLGQKMLAKNLTAGENVVNVATLNAGVYLAKFSAAGKTATKKLVIK